MIKNVKKYFNHLWKKTIVFSYLKLAKPASAFVRATFEHSRVKEIVGVFILTIFLLSNTVSYSTPTIQAMVDSNYLNAKNEIVETATEQSLQKPVGIFRITKGYSFFHPAIDLASDAGTAVLAILPGKVENVSRSRFGYGNHVIINHGSGLKSLYAHFVKINIKEGQLVDKETVIGFIGSTGWSTGPHLHLEISESGQRVNPRVFFETYFGEKLASLR